MNKTALFVILICVFTALAGCGRKNPAGPGPENSPASTSTPTLTPNFGSSTITRTANETGTPAETHTATEMLTATETSTISPTNEISPTITGTVTISLAEAVDNPSASIITSGAADWYASDMWTYSGPYSARAGAIGDNQSSSMTLNVTGPAQVSFYWWASSEANKDYLKLYLDGVYTDEISGLNGWDYKGPYIFGPGAHTVEWRFVKDASGADYGDTGYVDLVSVSALPTDTPTLPPQSTVTDTGTETQTFTVTETGTPTSSDTDTKTPTSTCTATETWTDTPTATVTETHTATETATETETDSVTATITETHTSTDTATQTGTFTVTETVTETPTYTFTGTETQTWTVSDTATETLTATGTGTFTGSPTMTVTLTQTSTATMTATASGTVTATVTNTPVVWAGLSTIYNGTGTFPCNSMGVNGFADASYYPHSGANFTSQFVAGELGKKWLAGTYAAIADYTPASGTYGQALLLNWNGANWTNVGSVSAGVYGGQCSIFQDPYNGDLYYAYTADTGDLKVHVKKYSGGSWTDLNHHLFGNKAAKNSVPGWVAISGYNNGTGAQIYVAYADWNSNSKVAVTNYDGVGWNNFGGTYANAAPGTYIDLVADGASYNVYLAYTEANRTYVKKSSGGVWASLGAVNPVSDANGLYNTLYIASASEVYVAYSDSGQANKATVKKFNGTSWSIVGNAGFTPAAVNYNGLYKSGSTLQFLYRNAVDSKIYQMTY